MRREITTNPPGGPGRGATTVSWMLSRAWSLPPQRNQVAVDRDLKVPMSDGTMLLADHYIPVPVASAPTVLVRCPYGRSFPFSLGSAQIIAERGYHVLLQSCRGTFGSGGEFEPMRNEIADGQDTVAWLREQDWFTGRLGTFGASYLGFVQWALAMDPPPELAAAVVQVGPHDFSRSAYRHGVFDLYNFLTWADLIAHQEDTGLLQGAVRNARAPRRLRPALATLPVRTGARNMLGAGSPWFESWLEHPELTDEFWTPLQCGAAVERTAVPTMVIGGWHDLFLEQTLEQYRTLAARGVPTRLLVGPWAHLDAAVSGIALSESLAWLDRYLGPGPRRVAGASAHPERSVRIWVGGEPETRRTSRVPRPAGRVGQWREIAGWPPPGAGEQRWYLGPHGTLRPRDAGRGPGRRARAVPLRPGRPHAVGGRRDHGPGRRRPGQPARRAAPRRPGLQQRAAGPAGRDHRFGRRRAVGDPR